MEYNFPANGTYLLNSGAPLDSRLCVSKIAYLTNENLFWAVDGNYNHIYNGMTVTCVEDLNVYVYKGRTKNEAGTAFNYDFSLETGWKLIGSAENIDLSDYVTQDVLSDYALTTDIPTVPTKVSEFENDAGYLTEHQDLSAYATTDALNQMKTDILGEGVSETFDTLKEIQAWIEGDGVNATELTQAIATETAARTTADSDLDSRIQTIENKLTPANQTIDGLMSAEDKVKLDKMTAKPSLTVTFSSMPAEISTIPWAENSLIEVDADNATCRIYGIDTIVNSNSTAIGGDFDTSLVTSVEIGDSVTTIGVNAFQYCSNLTSIVIGDAVTSIGDYAFAYCSDLTSVIVPDSVASIGRNTFYYCGSLTSVVIGDSVTSIDAQAFYGCDNLAMTFKNPTPLTTLNSGVVPYLVKQIIVPINSVDVYKTADGWSAYANKITAVATQEWVDTSYLTKDAFTYANGVLTINLD